MQVANSIAVSPGWRFAQPDLCQSQEGMASIMVKRLLLYVLAAGFLILGFIGLLIPVIPGVLFLLISAACFAATAPGISNQLHHNANWRHWRQNRGLSLFQRARLAFWLTACVAMDNIQQLRG